MITQTETSTYYAELKSIDKSVFDSFESFIWDSRKYFGRLNRSDNQITIYMPEYFNRMLASYFMSNANYAGRFNPDYISEFHGIKIVDGYENKVVISANDGLLYNIDPQEMPIP